MGCKKCFVCLSLFLSQNRAILYSSRANNVRHLSFRTGGEGVQHPKLVPPTDWEMLREKGVSVWWQIVKRIHLFKERILCLNKMGEMAAIRDSTCCEEQQRKSHWQYCSLQLRLQRLQWLATRALLLSAIAHSMHWVVSTSYSLSIYCIAFILFVR